MKITFDPETDAATIHILDPIPAGGAPRSQICDLEVPNGAVILLLSEAGQLVGLEILGATALLPGSVLKQA